MLRFLKKYKPAETGESFFRHYLFFNRFQNRACCWALGGQLCLGGGFVAVYQFASERDHPFYLLGFFFGLLLLSYALVLPMRMDLERSVLAGRNALTRYFLGFVSEKRPYYYDQDVQGALRALLQTNIPRLVNEYCRFYFALFSQFSTLLASSAVLVWFYGMIYLLPVFLTVISGVLTVRLIGVRHRTLAAEAENAENNFSQHLPFSWDAMLLNNVRLSRIFSEQLTLRWEKVKKNTLESEYYYRLRINLLGISIVVLFFGFTAFTYYCVSNSVFKLVVSMPLMQNVVLSALNLARELSYYNNLEGRFDSVVRTLPDLLEARLRKGPVENRIDFLRLKLSSEGNEIPLHPDFSEPGTGKMILQGENGAGKSTFLWLHKEKFAHAEYVPPHPHFLTESGESSPGSTGQNKRIYLEDVLQGTRTHPLFLDEPYANLDEKNKKRIVELVDETAQRRPVWITEVTE